MAILPAPAPAALPFPVAEGSLTYSLCLRDSGSGDDGASPVNGSIFVTRLVTSSSMSA